MKFNHINHIVVLGGSTVAFSFLKYLKKSRFNYHFFTNGRLLNDKLTNDKTLKQLLVSNKIKYFSTNDINKNKKIESIITTNSLIMGFGQPWVIKKKLLRKFKNKIVDFMGIPMPKYRGGAHYSWMILNGNREGGCFIQNVNEKTVQGSSDSGFYYMKSNYMYPKNLKIPLDFFNFSQKKEISFLKNFLKKIKTNRNFNLRRLYEKNSIFFPRLKAKINGFIDWDTNADEVVRFINAFSDPYPGATTFINKKKIFLKNATLLKRNNFHTYVSGLILNKFKEEIIIAAKKGIIKVSSVKNINFKNLIIGDRLYTEKKIIQKSKKHFKL